MEEHLSFIFACLTPHKLYGFGDYSQIYTGWERDYRLHGDEQCNDTFARPVYLLTGSTWSHLLYLGKKSRVITWPQTEVILKCAADPPLLSPGGKMPSNSYTSQARHAEPLFLQRLCERISARERAREGFSATINTPTICFDHHVDF